MPTLVWRGLDAPRMEIARVEVTSDGLVAEGTQIGLSYELRYELEPGRLRTQVVGGATLDIGLDGRDFFDLAYSPLFNTLPILGRLEEPRDFLMTFVDVPSLEVSESRQRYEPLGHGAVRFRAGSFVARIDLDDDGFVTCYEGLAERLGG